MCNLLDPAVLSLLVAAITLLVALVTLRVATQTKELQARQVDAERRQERRELAEAIDRYALWFCKEVTAEREVPPLEALSQETFALQRWSERIDQPGATAYWVWVKEILTGLRQDSNKLRPFEEAMLIANVGSVWVKTGNVALTEREIGIVGLPAK